jgi:hypothetical protein
VAAAAQSRIAGATGCSTAYGQSRYVLSALATEVDPPEADALDALLVEPAQPGVVPTDVVGAAVETGVLEPELDVRRRVQHLALHDEGRAVLGHPRRHPLVPGDVAVDGPVREHLEPAAGAQVCRRLADDPLDDRVGRQAGVAVDQSLAGRRGDHERRVGRDQVEGVAGDGLEERALADVDVREAVQRSVEAGEPQGPLVDVGGHDVLGVGRQVQGLDATAGAEVQGAAHWLTQGELGEGGGGRTDPEHVVRLDADRRAVETRRQVGGDPQVPVLGGVGPDVQQWPDLVGRSLDEALALEVVEEMRERALGAGQRNG